MTVERLDSLTHAVHNDHGGLGVLHAFRAYDRTRSRSAVAFIDLVVVPPGSSIGLHQHADDEETYVVLRGTGTMTLEEASFPVRAGDLVRNRAHGRHGLVNDGEEDLHLLVFEVEPAPLSGGDAS